MQGSQVPLGEHSDDRPQVSFWRRLGGGSLSISILVHALLLALGVFWILQVIPPEKPPEVDFMPKGGGGGQPGQKADVTMKKRAVMTPANAPRVAAKDVVSNFTLPEPDGATTVASIGALAGSSMSGGLGGSGSGGGRGDGKGTGFGSGMGPGLGGGGNKNPFGMFDPNANMLVGVFYDLKQDTDRKETDVSNDKVKDIIKDFTNRGWEERALQKYYRASQKLANSRIYIPIIPADEAPRAFNCDKEVKPGRWIAIYRANVTPPKSGKFRFVGVGDDILAVRFNKRNVFDHGFTLATLAFNIQGNTDIMAGKREDREVERILRGSPMKMPITFYQYETTRDWNRIYGGLAVGPTFEATAGNSYPLEILIGEIPGGRMGAALMIEEVGVTYQKTSGGSPILPVFRLDNTLPPKEDRDGTPPFDPQGPVWKSVGGIGKQDI